MTVTKDKDQADQAGKAAIGELFDKVWQGDETEESGSRSADR